MMLFLITSPEIVNDTLSGMGLPGAVIATLLATISALCACIVILFRMLNKQHADRKTETSTLTKLVENTNTALGKVVDATEERNRVTEALAEAIKVQAAAFEMVNQRIEFYHSGNIEKLNNTIQVIASMAEALRVNTGIVTEARNSGQTVGIAVNEMKATLASLASRGRSR